MVFVTLTYGRSRVAFPNRRDNYFSHLHAIHGTRHVFRVNDVRTNRRVFGSLVQFLRAKVIKNRSRLVTRLNYLLHRSQTLSFITITTATGSHSRATITIRRLVSTIRRIHRYIEHVNVIRSYHVSQ